MMTDKLERNGIECDWMGGAEKMGDLTMVLGRMERDETIGVSQEILFQKYIEIIFEIY